MNEAFWIFFYVSAALFVSIAAVLLSGECGHDDWNLEYISTQLAACLDTFPEASWAFVFTLQVQTCLLLLAWERLFCSTKLLVYFECVITMTAATFIISLASVVEFRADRSTRAASYPGVVESTLHGYAAVFTMLSFGGLHVLLAVSLLDLSYCEQQMIESPHLLACRQEYKALIQNYMRFDKAYFVCVAAFFILWPLSQSSGSDLFMLAAVSEWLILVLGCCMHVYAISQITRPLPWVPDKALVPPRSRAVRMYCLLCWAFSLTSTCLVFTFAPFSTNTDTDSLSTSIPFLLLVLSTYAGVGLLLSHFSLSD